MVPANIAFFPSKALLSQRCCDIPEPYRQESGNITAILIQRLQGGLWCSIRRSGLVTIFFGSESIFSLQRSSRILPLALRNATRERGVWRGARGRLRAGPFNMETLVARKEQTCYLRIKYGPAAILWRCTTAVLRKNAVRTFESCQISLDKPFIFDET